MLGIGFCFIACCQHFSELHDLLVIVVLKVLCFYCLPQAKIKEEGCGRTVRASVKYYHMLWYEPENKFCWGCFNVINPAWYSFGSCSPLQVLEIKKLSCCCCCYWSYKLKAMFKSKHQWGFSLDFGICLWNSGSHGIISIKSSKKLKIKMRITKT